MCRSCFVAVLAFCSPGRSGRRVPRLLQGEGAVVTRLPCKRFLEVVAGAEVFRARGRSSGVELSSGARGRSSRVELSSGARGRSSGSERGAGLRLNKLLG